MQGRIQHLWNRGKQPYESPKKPLFSNLNLGDKVGEKEGFGSNTAPPPSLEPPLLCATLNKHIDANTSIIGHIIHIVSPLLIDFDNCELCCVQTEVWKLYYYCFMNTLKLGIPRRTLTHPWRYMLCMTGHEPAGPELDTCQSAQLPLTAVSQLKGRMQGGAGPCYFVKILLITKCKIA